MAEPLFLGLDIGTSGVKAILVATDGDVVAATTTPLTLSTPRPGWAEQDPDDWWERDDRGRFAACSRSGPTPASRSVGISGQMHSSVFLDRAGHVVRPALLWCDGRTTDGVRRDHAARGRRGAAARLGAQPGARGVHAPEGPLAARTTSRTRTPALATVLLAKDFIRYRLTGTLATEPSDASGTLMFDPARLRWSDEILRGGGRAAQRCCLMSAARPRCSGASRRSGAAATGLRGGTPVVGGGADNACGAAGVGVITPGEAVASWGTSGTVLAPTAQPLVDPGLRAHTFCHVVPGIWYVMGVVLSAGGAFAWYRDQLARELAGTPAPTRCSTPKRRAFRPGRRA